MFGQADQGTAGDHQQQLGNGKWFINPRIINPARVAPAT
jgi:hypothetical protein